MISAVYNVVKIFLLAAFIDLAGCASEPPVNASEVDSRCSSEVSIAVGNSMPYSKAYWNCMDGYGFGPPAMILNHK